MCITRPTVQTVLKLSLFNVEKRFHKISIHHNAVDLYKLYGLTDSLCL